jgi:hypothetical protein
MAVPYTFANATTSIPLSQLDTNFATAITLGNTAVYLGNTVTTLGNVTMTGSTLNNPTVTNYTESLVAIGNSTSTQTLSLANGTVQTVTLTANCTFTMPSVGNSKSFMVFVNSGAGSFTATFSGVKWSGNTAPTITTTASKTDIITFASDGSSWYGVYSQNF